MTKKNPHANLRVFQIHSLPNRCLLRESYGISDILLIKRLELSRNSKVFCNISWFEPKSWLEEKSKNLSRKNWFIDSYNFEIKKNFWSLLLKKFSTLWVHQFWKSWIELKNHVKNSEAAISPRADLLNEMVNKKCQCICVFFSHVLCF